VGFPWARSPRDRDPVLNFGGGSQNSVRTLLSPTDSCRNPAGIRGFREFRRNQIWHRSQPKWEFHSGGILTGICIFLEWSPFPSPTESSWTPVDSTGLQLDSVPAKINIGPPKLEDWQSGGLRWTPVQLAIRWTPLDYSPPESTGLHQTPPDSTGLGRTDSHGLALFGHEV
jgi:hypothetical protein